MKLVELNPWLVWVSIVQCNTISTVAIILYSGLKILNPIIFSFIYKKMYPQFALFME